MDEENSKGGFKELLNKLLGVKKKETKEDIEELIKSCEDDGIVNEKESEMIRSIFSLSTTVVREIMVPRTDMVAISIESEIQDVIDIVLECGHSRIPVFEGNIDNIVGILYAKDLLKLWGINPKSVRSILRTPFFIPETINLEKLLQEFKLKHIHLAVVIDEYGGTSGLITIEDLLEEIVGDIQDEYDDEEELYTTNYDGSIVADAKISIDELEEIFNLKIERDKFDTASGLIFNIIGRIPEIGEKVQDKNFEYEILDADTRHIIKILVKPITKNEYIEQTI